MRTYSDPAVQTLRALPLPQTLKGEVGTYQMTEVAQCLSLSQKWFLDAWWCLYGYAAQGSSFPCHISVVWRFRTQKWRREGGRFDLLSKNLGSNTVSQCYRNCLIYPYGRHYLYSLVEPSWKCECFTQCHFRASLQYRSVCFPLLPNSYSGKGLWLWHHREREDSLLRTFLNENVSLINRKPWFCSDNNPYTSSFLTISNMA